MKIIPCESWRVQPALISLKRKKYLILNVYFPTDPKNINGDCPETEMCLAAIKTIISTTDFDHLHLAGDWNFESNRNTKHCNLIKDFLSENNLCSLWTKFDIDFTHCYENEEKETFINTLDHFVVLERCKPICVEAGVCHHPDNLSDHEPIFAVVDTIEQIIEIKDNIDTFTAPKFDWKNASVDQKVQ